jgi:uncharacterized protein
MIIRGTPGSDILVGSAEEDWVKGRAGPDLLVGDDGVDVLFGNAGDDALRGDGDADVDFGGDGNDSFVIGAGGDHLFGEAGNDSFIVVPGGDVEAFFAERTGLLIETDADRHEFTVELAQTAPEWILGLMFREGLAEGRGMLFDFGVSLELAFHMRNTFIPLDLFFVDAEGTIVTVAERATPLSEELIPSGAPIRAVLEVPAGTAAALGIGVGDRLLHPIFGTADPAASDDACGGADDQGRNGPLGGTDTIYDFTPGEDLIDLTLFGSASFADLDTDGDGELGAGDDQVSITEAGDTVIRLPTPSGDPTVAYSLTVADVTGLNAADFLFLA